MSLDSTEVGIQAARAMADLEAAAERGDFPAEGAEVLAALVIIEVRHVDEDGDTLSTISGRVTEDRSVIALGLLERARETFLRPDGDLAGE